MITLPPDMEARLIAAAQAASGGRRCCCCGVSGWCAFDQAGMGLVEAFEKRMREGGDLEREWQVVRRAWQLAAWRRRLLAAGVGPDAFTVPAWRALVAAAVREIPWVAVEGPLCPDCWAAVACVFYADARGAWGGELAEMWLGERGASNARALLKWALDRVNEGGDRAVVEVIDALVVSLGAALDRTVLTAPERTALDGLMRERWAAGLTFETSPSPPLEPAEPVKAHQD